MNLKLNDIDIKDIQTRCEKTTKGPWSASGIRSRVLDRAGKRPLEGFPIIAGKENIALVWFSEDATEAALSMADKEFIARSRTWVPDLLEDRKAMQDEIERLRNALSAAGWGKDYDREMHPYERPYGTGC